MDERRQVGQQETWGRVVVFARRFLDRWSDAFTCSYRDDIAQDAALAFWCYTRGSFDAVPMEPIVRTISRRLRGRALEAAVRGGVVAESDPGVWPEGDAGETPCLRVDGALVPRDWLLMRLLALLSRLSSTNRRIVLAYYEGFSCVELGARLGLTEEAVKVRLHRSRAILRRRLEALTRAAGHFER